MLALMGKFGRLGNQLWTYANVLAFAVDRRIPLVNPAFEFRDFFIGPHCCYKNPNDGAVGLVRDGSFARKLIRLAYKINLRTRTYPFVQLGESSLLDLDAADECENLLARSRFAFLSGFYFRAASSLERHKAYVRSFFAVIPDLEKQVWALVTAARGDSDVLVGIHVRHGDYRTYCGGLMYYRTEEYAEAMHCISEQLPGRRVSFLVCSDEPQSTAPFVGLNVHFSQCEPVVDMYSLGRCDYILGPNSTFTHWASFYGNVRLHILDWKSAEAFGRVVPIRRPDLEKDFLVYSPREFGKYSERQVNLRDLLRPS